MRKDPIEEKKYAPPYPQSFYPFWPKHALKAGLLVAIIFIALLLLAYFYRVPTDPAYPPLPDDGAYIPAPEWYLFFLFQPFWYLTGDNAKWLPIGTFWLPLALLVLLFSVPFVFRRRAAKRKRMSTPKKAALAMATLLVWALSMGAVVGSGAPAKTLGCPSCHNPMMGVRQALPPANMAEFYLNERQQQINVGGYRIGDENRVAGSYKDANWQLRHFYEPTMTW